MARTVVVLQGVRLALLSVALFIAIGLALRIGVIVFEPRLAFHPVRDYHATPGEIGMPFEDVFFTATDGVRLHGWFVPGDVKAQQVGRRPLTLLFFHGNAENIGECLDLVVRAREAGYPMLVVDYRGYGESAGSPTETGLYNDGRAALDYLRSRPDVDDGRIVVWGRSIGAAIAVDAALTPSPKAGDTAAAAKTPAGVILESGFTSVRELLDTEDRWILRNLSRFGTYRFDTAARIGKMTSPLLVIHGTRDEVVPFRLGRALYDAAPGRKELLAIEGGGHNDLFAAHADAIWEAVHRFLQSLG